MAKPRAMIEIRISETEKLKKLEIWLWGNIVGLKPNYGYRDVKRYFKTWKGLLKFLDNYFAKRRYLVKVEN